MAIIPGNSGTSAKAVDGIEGPTAGTPVSFPSGFKGSLIPETVSDANLTMSISSPSVIVMNPTALRTVTLPSTSVPANYSVTVINRSASFGIEIRSSNATLITTVGLGQVTVLSTQATPTTGAHWSISTNGAVLQGGNSFGAAMRIGTNDAFGLELETNGVTNLAISSGGIVTVGPTSAIGGNTFAGNNIVGRTNGSTVGAGYKGERKQQDRLYAAALGVTTNTWTNILATPVTLEPGVWLLFGHIGFRGSSTSVNNFEATISDVSGTFSTDENLPYFSDGATRNIGTWNLEHGFAPSYINISASKTFYLVARATFGASTVSCYGRVVGVRIA